MARKLSLVFTAVLIVALLGNCREGLSYEYDLIKVKSQNKTKEGLWTSISPESKKRYMGAVIVNGPPFSLSVAIDHAYYDPTEIKIKSITVQKKVTSEIVLHFPPEQTIHGSWVNHGVLSSWDQNPSFTFQVDKQEDICIKTTLSKGPKDKFEINECFSLVREKGKAKMKLKDVLNQ